MGGGSFLSDTLPEEKAAELRARARGALQGDRCAIPCELLEPLLDLHAAIRDHVVNATDQVDGLHLVAREDVGGHDLCDR